MQEGAEGRGALGVLRRVGEQLGHRRRLVPGEAEIAAEQEGQPLLLARGQRPEAGGLPHLGDLRNLSADEVEDVGALVGGQRVQSCRVLDLERGARDVTGLQDGQAHDPQPFVVDVGHGSDLVHDGAERELGGQRLGLADDLVDRLGVEPAQRRPDVGAIRAGPDAPAGEGGQHLIA